jgi:YD repeat-containing protein
MPNQLNSRFDGGCVSQPWWRVSLGPEGTLHLHPSLGLNRTIGDAIGEVLIMRDRRDCHHCFQHQYSFDANNRITGSGFTYDAAGNLINDGIHSYTYDAENRIVKVDGGSTAVYTNDYQGRRVAKIAGATHYEYLFDLSDRAMSELLPGTSTANRVEVYVGGRHLAVQDVGTGTT